MYDAIKEACLAALPPADVAAIELEAPPDYETEQFCTCVNCGHTGANVWSTSEAKVANCSECGVEFTPILEGSKHTIITLVERRRRMRRKGLSVKDEIFRMMRV